MGRSGGDTGRSSASRLARPGEAAVEEEIGRAKERHRRVAGAAEEEPHARVAEGPQLGPLRSDHGRHVQRPQIVQRLALRVHTPKDEHGLADGGGGVEGTPARRNRRLHRSPFARRRVARPHIRRHAEASALIALTRARRRPHAAVDKRAVAKGDSGVAVPLRRLVVALDGVGAVSDADSQRLPPHGAIGGRRQPQPPDVAEHDAAAAAATPWLAAKGGVCGDLAQPGDEEERLDR